jgi:hypothetical protein
MTKQEEKLYKYLSGVGDSIKLLAWEIKDADAVGKDDLDLIAKIGANLLFNSKSFEFIK